MASTLPAIMLSTVGSNLALSELSIDGVGTRGVRHSAISDICPALIYNCGAAGWRRPMSGVRYDHDACFPIYL
jgi:hypothetical protein